jgi:hypothetical protein
MCNSTRAHHANAKSLDCDSLSIFNGGLPETPRRTAYCTGKLAQVATISTNHIGFQIPDSYRHSPEHFSLFQVPVNGVEPGEKGS